MRHSFLVAATVAGTLWAWPQPVSGQAADGHLVGIVLDQSGSSIPGCAVEVENVSTGVVWNQETDQLGAYRFNNLPSDSTRCRPSRRGSRCPGSPALPSLSTGRPRSTLPSSWARSTRKSKSPRQQHRSTPRRRRSRVPSIPAKHSTAPVLTSLWGCSTSRCKVPASHPAGAPAWEKVPRSGASDHGTITS